MSEYSALAQNIAPGGSVVFALTPVPDRGLILRAPNGFLRRFWLTRHREGTAGVLLNGNLPLFSRKGCCCDEPSIGYPISFHGNIALATGGTVGPISLAVFLDNAQEPASVMTSTPAAVEEFNNVGTDITAEVWQGCCQTVTIQNISDQEITLSNGSLVVGIPNLNR